MHNKEFNMKIESMEQLEHLLSLVKDYKLDMIEVDNIKIIKSKHDYPTPLNKSNPQTKDEELEELLFHSA